MNNLEYRYKVFRWLHGLKDGDRISIVPITRPETRAKFIEQIKLFIEMNAGGPDGFFIELSSDQTEVIRHDVPKIKNR